jgi:ATP phosphoribosyltransferase
MSTKFERAGKMATTQEVTPIAKSDRLWSGVDFLSQVDPSLQKQTRQRLLGEKIGNVIKTKDVMALLNQESLNCRWGVIPMDKLFEWAWENDYEDFNQLKSDFDLVPLGGGECTVEIACDPDRQDLIDVFSREGINGLAKYLKQSGEKIATDTPGIAEYFFGNELLFKLSGSLEALPKSLAPVIIGVVESGNSLTEEKWLRLSEKYKQAVLLKSQLILIIRKEK